MIVGVDPGLSGALFFLDRDSRPAGGPLTFPVHPHIRNKVKNREVDIQSLVALLSNQLTHVFIELVGPMPRLVPAALSVLARLSESFLACSARTPPR
jgi:hypothetical protein